MLEGATETAASLTLNTMQSLGSRHQMAEQSLSEEMLFEKKDFSDDLLHQNSYFLEHRSKQISLAKQQAVAARSKEKNNSVSIDDVPDTTDSAIETVPVFISDTPSRPRSGPSPEVAPISLESSVATAYSFKNSLLFEAIPPSHAFSSLLVQLISKSSNFTCSIRIIVRYLRMIVPNLCVFAAFYQSLCAGVFYEGIHCRM